MNRIISLILTSILLLVSSPRISSSVSSTTSISKPQFPHGSEFIPMPKIVILSIYMGVIKYPHLPLLLESMRRNYYVDFKVINILTNTDVDVNSNSKSGGNDESIIASSSILVESLPHETTTIIRLRDYLRVSNLHVHYLTLSQFNRRLLNRFNYSFEVDASWYYKMCDFKPTLAYLFPELLVINNNDNNENSNLHNSGRDRYKYWGYADMDLIWGNISRWSFWFQGQYPFIHADQHISHGALSIYITQDWTIELFLLDPMYLQLLRNKTYFNLDEIGTQIKKEYIVNHGLHAIAYAQVKAAKRRQFDIHCNRGSFRRDKPFLDQTDSAEWAGPVLWHEGKLMILHGSNEFPPRRELMIYHRPSKTMGFAVDNNEHHKDHDRDHDVSVGEFNMMAELFLDRQSSVHHVFRDMIEFGFLLPSWIPLISPILMCRHAGDNKFAQPAIYRNKYQPYDRSACAASPFNDFDVVPEIRFDEEDARNNGKELSVQNASRVISRFGELNRGQSRPKSSRRRRRNRKDLGP